MANNSQDTFGELRHNHFDGSDPFMTGGHQILKIRRQKRETPEWTKNDEEIKKLLLRSFPSLKTNAFQRAGAARWTRFIHLYYRIGMTCGQIGEEMKISFDSAQNLSRRIARASRGIKANGAGPFAKKDGDHTQTSLGTTPEKG
jgi:hypothetical protein